MFIVKLGGSCITDKSKPFTPRMSIIKSLAKQLKGKKVIIAHGSGSFGHVPAKKYMTKQGFVNGKSLYGMSLVQDAASRLNRIVVSELLKQKIPAISFQPSSSIVSEKGRIKKWDISAIRVAMRKGVIPVVYGDVVTDLKKGCSIISTEDLILHLSKKLKPSKVIMCTDVEGVYVDGKVAERITNNSFSKIKTHLRGAKGADVTGGMAQKVMLALKISKFSKVLIINGAKKGNLRKAIQGKRMGTTVL